MSEKIYKEIDGCLFCRFKDLKIAINFGNMPFTPGVTEQPETEMFYPFLFVICQNCGLLQQKNLVKPSLLYSPKFQNEGVGKTWAEHYEKLAEFIKKNISGGSKKILDIGSAHGRMAEYFDASYEFTLCDPNFAPVENKPNIKFVNKFFEDYETEEKYDVILLSHLFEHINDHISFITKAKGMLSAGGKIIISIPNFSVWIHKSFLNAFVQEHSVYPAKEVVVAFFNSLGMQSDSIELYGEHSVFFAFSKSPVIASATEAISSKKKIASSDALLAMTDKFRPKRNAAQVQSVIRKFDADIAAYKKMLKDISGRYTAVLKDQDYYIYGAHIFAQILLFSCGLNINHVLGALDNSKSKRGKYLCGTTIKCLAPEEIKHQNKPVVVLNAGAYTNEIRENLKTINPQVVIIE